MKLFDTNDANQWICVISLIFIVITEFYFCCKFPAVFFIHLLAWLGIFWSSMKA